MLNMNNKLLKLLFMILKETKETRADMGCNDAYPSEENLFTNKERKEMAIELCGTKGAKDRDYYLSNSEYVSYLIKHIKYQRDF